MNKPIILAICGKSATGKDSLAHWLKLIGQNKNIPVNLLVSDTTRPPREKEIKGVNYNFISAEQFKKNQLYGKYLESVKFRDWFYGTRVDSIKLDVLNIGIFNPEGLKQIRRNYFIIIPIYLEEPLTERLRRSYRRERKWKLEYFRRAAADWKAFLKIKEIIASYSYSIIFPEENKSGIVKKSRQIYWLLDKWHLIPGQ